MIEKSKFLPKRQSLISYLLILFLSIGFLLACSGPKDSKDDDDKSVVDQAIESVGALNGNVSTALRSALNAIVEVNDSVTQGNLNFFAASYAQAIADTLGPENATETQQAAIDAAAVASFASIDPIITEKGVSRSATEQDGELLKGLFHRSTRAIIETALKSETLDDSVKAALTATAKGVVDYLVESVTDASTIVQDALNAAAQGVQSVSLTSVAAEKDITAVNYTASLTDTVAGLYPVAKEQIENDKTVEDILTNLEITAAAIQTLAEGIITDLGSTPNGDSISEAASSVFGQVLNGTTSDFSIPEILNEPDLWPTVTSAIAKDPTIEAAVADLVAQMSVAQKVGQMVQPEIQHTTPADVKQYHLGSILNGGGSFPNENKNSTINDWVTMADAYYEASIDTTADDNGSDYLAIPVIWGTDAVHGHNNVIGATIFPHNIGLGAANNPELMKQIGAITAKEVAVTGIDWVFGPTVAVVRDDRWGRTYEGYSEDPDIVKSYAGMIVQGLQGTAGTDELFNDAHVVATAKHFVGDGGTVQGIDQGNNTYSEADLLKIHAQGYLTAIEAGAQTVMASFNSWHGKKLHGRKYLLTTVLKEKMGFDGYVIGDWNGHGQVKGCADQSCAQAINAGVDMIMVPYASSWKPFIENTIAQVENGEISMDRINDAVTRILRVKMRAGLLGPHTTKGKPSSRTHVNATEIMGAADSRTVARQAVRESLVLLKNKGGMLPLSKNAKILVAGKSADDIGNQSGGWTISWQGTGNVNSDFPGGTSIWGGIQATVPNATLSVDGSEADASVHDVAIVVIGETPYAEGVGDINSEKTLEHQYGDSSKGDLALVTSIKEKGIPVVTVFVAGRPLWVNNILNKSDAFVAAWLPGSEGAGVADVLIDDGSGNPVHDFKGKLSYSWPKTVCQTSLNRHDENYDPLFAYGFGLTYGDTDTLGDDLDETTQGTGCDSLILGDADAATSDLEIFVQDNKGDYRIRIGSQADWNGTAVTPANTEFEHITAATIQKDVQQDTRTITWLGTGEAEFYSDSFSNVDLRSYLLANAVLAFDMRVDSAPTADVNIRVDCGWPCHGLLPFNDLITANGDGEWHRINIDLQCFKKAGTDFSKINRPLLVTSKGAATLSFANIKWEINKATGDPCPGDGVGPLVEAISTATNLLNSTTVGTEPGNVSQAGADAFSTAITSAQAVVDNAESTQEDIEAAISSLETATLAFKAAFVPPAVTQNLAIISGAVVDSQWTQYVGENATGWGGITMEDIANAQTIQMETAPNQANEADKAIKVTFSGEGAQYYFEAAESLDLSGYLAVGGSLKFDIKLEAAPSDSVNLDIRNVWPARGSIDITTDLNALTIGEWTTLSYSLQGFADAAEEGFLFSEARIPILIGTGGTMTFVIDNIHWEVP